MSDKLKVIVSNKKTPKGVVNIFGNIQNKVGTYDRDKLEQFKKKLLEKSMEFGEKFLFVFDEIDYAMDSVTDRFFDKIIDRIESYRSRNTVNDEVVSVDRVRYSNDEDKSLVMGEIVPVRSINYEDLEPLGKVIDEEDNIYELQELKMELLSGVHNDEISKDNNEMRKK